MGESARALGDQGFQFIGRMTASITHEIKNALAVIRENAGLMEDLVLMGERKGNLDPGRIKDIAAKIGKQAMKADGIVQNMNRFAHSMDEPSAELDLVETLNLLIALSGRLAAMRGVVLETRVPDAPLWVDAHSIYLETFLWECLDAAMDAAGSRKRLSIVLEPGEGEAARIRIQGVETEQEAKVPGSAPGAEGMVRRVLGADVAFKTTGDEMVIELPRHAHLEKGPESRE